MSTDARASLVERLRTATEGYADLCEEAADKIVQLYTEAANLRAALAAAQAATPTGLNIAVEALEEICRGTDMRAGNQDAWAFGVANKALAAIRALRPPAAEAESERENLSGFLRTEADAIDRPLPSDSEPS